MGHTPGPWKYERRNGAQHIDSADLGLSICDEQYYPWVQASEADWRLIAAAPDLLEACKAMRWHSDTCQMILIADAEFPFPCNCGYALAQVAIAKAEGK